MWGRFVNYSTVHLEQKYGESIQGYRSSNVYLMICMAQTKEGYHRLFIVFRCSLQVFTGGGARVVVFLS